jgi:hypothetical protein
MRTVRRVAKVSARRGFRDGEVSASRPVDQAAAPRPVARGLSEEKYYTPQELADIWRFSPATIRNLFRNEPGVLRLQGMGSACGKRSYTTFSIPESVAIRVRERLTQEPVQAQFPRRAPRRVVFLRKRKSRAA